MTPRAGMVGLLAATVLTPVLLLGGCTSDTDEPDGSPSPAPGARPTTPAAAADGVSTPVEDGLYPEVGDPGVDALSYHLDLTWQPDRERLRGTERLQLRSTADADHLQLDLAPDLTVRSVTVDGEPAPFDHDGKDLVVQQDVRRDRRYTLVIEYAGRPQPVPAPTERSDFDSTGWTTTSDGGAWTMQEPYGAYTWYAVNDQPSDKALYSFRITTPAPLVGVANGELQGVTEVDGRVVSRWLLDDPAASYLVTIAIGDYELTESHSMSGTPLTYSTPWKHPEMIDLLRRAQGQLAWLEQRLGPYPFDSLGFVVVPSASAVETQTMITMGDTEAALAPTTIVHEMAHQWWGDLVTPTDWRGVWMNEGMASYLEVAWDADHAGPELAVTIDDWAAQDQQLRDDFGPPADPEPSTFGASNVYLIPAVMWHELRQRLGDETFWRLVREWPASHAGGSADYDDITTWWSEQSGEDLESFFYDWLLGDTTPARG